VATASLPSDSNDNGFQPLQKAQRQIYNFRALHFTLPLLSFQTGLTGLTGLFFSRQRNPVNPVNPV